MAGRLPLSEASPLIFYAIRKLNPEIFSHPVWVRFGGKNTVLTAEEMQELFMQAEQLQVQNSADACQLMLICSALQSYSGRLDKALGSAQQALAQAERNHLTKEMIWAIWGACAICYQAANYEQVSRYLEYLESELNDQNDWILANMMDVIRQSLCQPKMNSIRGESNLSNIASSDPIRFTLQWLQNWGIIFQDPQSEGQSKWKHGHITYYLGKWGTRWNRHTNSERQLSVWQSLCSLLHLQEYSQNTEFYADPQEIPGASKKVSGAIPQGAPSHVSPAKIKVAARMDNASGSNSMPVSANDKTTVDHFIGETTTYLPMAVYMLGTFTLMIGEKSVKLPMSRGLSVFQYLLFHHGQPASREVLMDIFWPDAEPETARNNLNVALYGLRTALRSVTFLPVILFEEGAYGLSPDLHLWLDVEEFENHVKSGHQLESQQRLLQAVSDYETAISLYKGDLLGDSPYESWTVLDRERLRILYLDTLAHLSLLYFNQERYAACMTLCQLILARDPCREDAHCRLMQCYSRLGQGSLALRQYRICVQALQTELQVDPAPETTRLYERVRQHQQV